MSQAAADVLACLPCPPHKANHGASSLLGDQLLAYAAGTSIVIVDVLELQLATVLCDFHQQPVTAVAWCPENQGRHVTPSSPLRIASGDAEGRAVIWNVQSGSPICGLHDVMAAASARRLKQGQRSAICALTWISSDPSKLAIALDGLLVVMDAKGGVVFKQEFGLDLSIDSIHCDPTDGRALCMCGSKGSLVFMQFSDNTCKKATQKTCQIGFTASRASEAVQCAYSAVQGLLYILLPYEVMVYDLEYDQTAASTGLSSSHPHFLEILGCWGHRSLGRAVHLPGIDYLCCLHLDGYLSLWQRDSDQLKYHMQWILCLLPPPSRIRNNTRLNVVCCHALPQRRGNASSENGRQQERSGMESELADYHLSCILCTDDGQVWRWCIPFQDAGKVAERTADQGPSKYITQVVAESAESYAEPRRGEGSGRRNGSVAPDIESMMHTLSSSVTTIAVHAQPVMTSCMKHVSSSATECVGVLAAVTSSGTLEIVEVLAGRLRPLHMRVTIRLSVHKERVRGVRWLGRSPRLVTFSTEKQASGGWKNSLALTDVRTRVHVPFRENASDSEPLLSIKCSHSEKYILLVFDGQPSEVWQIDSDSKIHRTRMLNLPFTAVDWVIPGNATGSLKAMPALPVTTWQRSMQGPQVSSHIGEDEEHEGTHDETAAIEEDLLGFSITDGRVGVLAVKDSKVKDTNAKRPVIPANLSGSLESSPTALAGWGHLIFLGTDDGVLHRWDTRTGHTQSIATNQGMIRRISLAPPPESALREALSQPQGNCHCRIAVLFTNGTFSVFELDANNELKSTNLGAKSTVKLGRVSELGWLALPSPIGSGFALVVATEQGSICVVETLQSLDQRSQRHRLAPLRSLMAQSASAPKLRESAWVKLTAVRPSGSALLLPRAWLLLLRLVIHLGVPPKLLKACIQAAPGQSASNLETEMIGIFPQFLQQAWAGAKDQLISEEAPVTADREVRHLMRQSSSLKSQPLSARDSTGSRPSDSRWPSESRRDFTGSAASYAASQASEDAPSFSTLDLQSPTEPQLLQTVPRQRGARSGIMEQMSRLRVGAEALTGGAKGSGHDSDGLPALPFRVSADIDAHTPASFSLVVQALTKMRADGQLLYPDEWDAYQQAFSVNSVAERMAVAAAAEGDATESQFWKALPVALQELKRSLPESCTGAQLGAVVFTDPQTGLAVHHKAEDHQREKGDIKEETSGNGSDQATPSAALWSPALQICQATERTAWHDKLPQSTFDSSVKLQEFRMLKYVVIGDYNTAVGFLMAAAPDLSSHFYRNALNTYALAAAKKEAFVSSSAGPEPLSRTLQIQVAKIVTAHAASVGDTLLGVPLLCSAGLPVQAASILQDSGLWRDAATLSAKQLNKSEQATALQRWAGHILQAEGRLWYAVGVLIAAGALRTAVMTLREAGLPDRAMALADAARSAGFAAQSSTSDADGLEDWHQATNLTPRRQGSIKSDDRSREGALSLKEEFERYCINLVESL